MNMIKKIAKKIMMIIVDVSPILATKILFRYYMGKKIDLNNPKTFNEKMQWLKLNSYNNNPLITKCVDKYLVREYVKKCGCENILVKLLGVWDAPEQIDFSLLPDKFVLKCNHGSGSIIICRDKNKLDIEDTINKLRGWMREDFGLQRAELSYKNVRKKIICEELIDTDNDKAPNDYKFFCSYGEPKFLFCATNRKSPDDVCFDFFSMDWEHYPVINGHPNSPIPVECPPHFDEMVDAAKRLSKDFPLVRVDLYDESCGVRFGELTFLHFGGLHPFVPEKYDYFFGDMIEIGKGICSNEK